MMNSELFHQINQFRVYSPNYFKVIQYSPAFAVENWKVSKYMEVLMRIGLICILL